MDYYKFINKRACLTGGLIYKNTYTEEHK
ncbi:hypothetical protein PT2222_120125 [Paraburkholderia tropica]